MKQGSLQSLLVISDGINARCPEMILATTSYPTLFLHEDTAAFIDTSNVPNLFSTMLFHKEYNCNRRYYAKQLAECTLEYYCCPAECVTRSQRGYGSLYRPRGVVTHCHAVKDLSEVCNASVQCT